MPCFKLLKGLHGVLHGKSVNFKSHTSPFAWCSYKLILQLSQSPLDNRPSYDAIEGANVTPTTFYNIGDFEVQDNLARIWYQVSIECFLMFLFRFKFQTTSSFFSRTNLFYAQGWYRDERTVASRYSDKCTNPDKLRVSFDYTCNQRLLAQT